MNKKILLFSIDVLKESVETPIFSYDVITCTNIDDAKNILSVQDIALIICYEDRPSNKSLYILTELSKEFPLTIRVLFMQIIVDDIIVKAFMNNLVHLALTPPYKEIKISKIFFRLLETEDTLKSTNIKELLGSVNELPTIGTIYNEITTLIEKDASLYEVSQVIEKDQALTAKVLHLVNSAYYFIKTGSVSHAISYLGYDILKNIVLTTSIIEALNVPKFAVKKTELLWNHSFITNKLLIFIYEEVLKKKLADNLLSTGLLHNIGMVFIIKYFYEEYIDFIKNKDLETNSLQLENKLFKIDHQLIGGYLLRWWGFNFPVVEACLYHHEPLNENIINKELLLTLHIAEHYAYKHLNQKNPNIFYENCFFLLEIEKSDFEKSLERFQIPY